MVDMTAVDIMLGDEAFQIAEVRKGFSGGSAQLVGVAGCELFHKVASGLCFANRDARG
jgi:hypothetical protein